MAKPAAQAFDPLLVARHDMSNDKPRKDVDVYWSVYASVGHASSNLMMISMDAD